jgi:hypothetical protein
LEKEKGGLTQGEHESLSPERDDALFLDGGATIDELRTSIGVAQ